MRVSRTGFEVVVEVTPVRLEVAWVAKPDLGEVAAATRCTRLHRAQFETRLAQAVARNIQSGPPTTRSTCSSAEAEAVETAVVPGVSGAKAAVETAAESAVESEAEAGLQPLAAPAAAAASVAVAPVAVRVAMVV